jgi:hypothetical protein
MDFSTIKRDMTTVFVRIPKDCRGPASDEESVTPLRLIRRLHQMADDAWGRRGRGFFPSGEQTAHAVKKGDLEKQRHACGVPPGAQAYVIEHSGESTGHVSP